MNNSGFTDQELQIVSQLAYFNFAGSLVDDESNTMIGKS